ncbi:imidazole glycerol phosphate synthase subunit HisF [Herbaspirillum sp. SJZ099]|uniref:imidazole glycerol phosphate synthase subunit HisF n=1 Tax=Herbaspirillum sp. SJZ099 TaxID=2572916 RepID=UPI00119E4C72|nr:imidazole glycerol phosphate synthase cyclase subunit [Herbaspirillum sp. SJZ099]TWC68377.1 cyclase [Herbaspirillum sp. SJZ099]
MLKKRIIPKFLIRNGRLVKGVRFHDNFREAGNPVSTAKVYDAYGVDELLFVDIDATPEGRPASGSIIERVSEEVFMPFTVGGGIRSLEAIATLLRSGADKVSITTAAVENPGFVREAASRFGDQCIVVGIDYKRMEDGSTKVVSHCGRKTSELDPVEWALRMQDSHAGEILLCSIDRDGTMSGYDLDLIAKLTDKLEIPIIASSGAGSLRHCHEALDAGASAITISSMFLFSDHSPIKVRSYLSTNGVSVRSQKGSHS